MEELDLPDDNKVVETIKSTELGLHERLPTCTKTMGYDSPHTNKDLTTYQKEVSHT